MSTVFLHGCGTSEEREFQNERLRALVSQRATIEQIAIQLGSNYFVFERGTTNWDGLTSYLARDHRDDIRGAIGDSERVMYYTTANLMSWLILDDHSRITNYYLCGQ